MKEKKREEGEKVDYENDTSKEPVVAFFFLWSCFSIVWNLPCWIRSNNDDIKKQY